MSKSDAQIQAESDKRIRAAAKKGLPKASGAGGLVADWHNASAELVLRLVCVVGVQGGAVRFGYTRDGGAYSVGLYLGADSQTYYCNDAEGINDELEFLIKQLED